MKVKTIKKVLKKKVEDWAATIEDKRVQGLVEKNTIITGGAPSSMLLKEPVNDYDVYFRTRETAIAVAQYYVKRFKIQARKGIPCKISVDTSCDDRVKIVIKSAGIASEDGTSKPYEYFESRAEGEAGEYVNEVMNGIVNDSMDEESIIDDPGEVEDTYERTEEAALQVDNEKGKAPYRPVFMSTNAITLSGKIQIIMRFYGSPEEIHKNFDFQHCTNYWKSWDNELVLNPHALECLLTKELRYIGSKYPVCSLFRLRKFIKRGWSINAGEILKIAMQISALDLTDVNVLQDQLIGMDVSFFMEVLAKLKEKDPVRVNYCYLIELIDRLF